MATTVKSLTGTEEANAEKIAASRGTSGALTDPAQREGLALVTQAVQQQLVEEADYVKVRNSGTAEIVVKHSYWYPGEVRILAPGELDSLQETYKDVKGFALTEVKAEAQNLADLHDQHVANVQEVSGNYFIGEKQAAAIDLGLVAEPTDKDKAATRKAADQKDAAIQAQAERDNKKPLTNAERDALAKDQADRDAANNRAQAAQVDAKDTVKK